MPEHVYNKADLANRFDAVLGKTLEEIDTKGLFNHVQEFNLQKGVVGSLIEQCVLGYNPDSKQEADLVVVDGESCIKTELKSTGMLLKADPKKHFVAKEPMSITAVGVYDIAEQDFWTSHFWNKLEHMLLVYYLYKADHPVTPYEYRLFPIKGYEFHKFDEADTEILKQDWEHVRELAVRVTAHHPGPRTKEWKEAVKQEYIDVHGELRRVLNYVDLAPKFPPRFRLKKPVVSAIISKHFGYQLEQLPGRYAVITDIDKKCRELTELYAGETIGQLTSRFGLPCGENKSICEKIAVAMFGGKSKKLNQIELFSRFGLIGKSIVMTPTGGRTEDMKLFHIDFNEMVRTEVVEESEGARPIQFEDSELYAYFADHEFLCIMYEEPAKEHVIDELTGKRKEKKHPLGMNKFIGFKRLVFSDEFIDTTVRKLWDDTRGKVMNGTLEDVPEMSGGKVKILRSGDISSAPNFMKSSENTVFVRGSATDASHKTECVNGIRMLPQYVWIKGTAVIDELKNTPAL